MISNFPQQKVADGAKTPTWFKECHEWVENKIVLSSRYGYSAKAKSIKLRAFYEDGIISKQELANIINPTQLQWTDIPDNIKHYPVAKPYILPLKGEELKRRFDWAVIVTNRDAVSKKELDRKALVDEFIVKTITNKDMEEEEFNQVVEDFMSDQHSWQDLRETGMSELLKYYWEHLDLKSIFAEAWDKELIEGKAILDIDEYNNIPSVELLEPSCVFTTKIPGTHWIDDVDMVAIEQYLPISMVKDRYYEFLTDTHIKYLDERFSDGNVNGMFSPEAFYDKITSDAGLTTYQPSELIHPHEFQYDGFKGYFDTHGNVRVVKVRWIGERRVGFLSYFDEEGNPQEMIVPDDFKPDPLKSQSIRYKYINEAYESTKIGENIYIKQQVRNVQYRKLDNKSYCHLGIVGIEYDRSMFETMKVYNVLYNAYMHKLEEVFVNTIGNIGVLNAAMIPEGWDVEKTLYYGRKLGFIVVDPFREGTKGRATGKLAGETSGIPNQIQIENYQLIQQCFVMLQYIETQLDKAFGINSQRRGLVQQDAGLGTTQEAVQASLNATEWWFYQHDKLKLKTLRLLSGVIKFCLRNGSEVMQYVASDATLTTFKIDGEDIQEADYNIMILNSKIDEKAEVMLQEGIKAGFQTGQVDILQMMDIYSNDSISSIRRKLTRSIKESERNKQQQEQAQREHEQQLQALINEDKELDRQLQKYKIDQDNATKIQTAQINVYQRQVELDQNMNGIPDPAELAANALAQQKLSQEKFVKDKEQVLKQKELMDKVQMKREELVVKERIEKEKTKQVHVQNKNQIELANKAAALKEKEMKNKILLERIKAKKKKSVGK